MSSHAKLLAVATGLQAATRISKNFDYWSRKAAPLFRPNPTLTLPSKKRKMPYRRSYRAKRFRAQGTTSYGGFNTGPRFRGSLPRRSLRPQLKFAPNDSVGHDYTVSQEDDSRLVSLNAGDTPTSRDGRVTRIMNIRGQMIFPGGEDQRLVIYTPLDNQDRISLANVGDSIDPDRFKVWYDNHWYAVGISRSVQFNLNFGQYGHKIHYDGPLADDVTRGDVRMYQYNAAATSNSRGSVITSFVDT